MKTSQKGTHSAKPIGVRFLLPVVIGAAIISTLPAAVGAASADSQSKTYTLFMGADFSIAQGRDFYRVQGADRDSLLIAVDGKTIAVSEKTGPVSLQVAPVLKLTEASASITDLKGERTYTWKNDPNVRLQKALRDAADLNAAWSMQVNDASAKMDDLEHGVAGGTQAVANSNGFGPGNSSVSNDMATAAMQASLNHGLADLNSATGQPGSNVILPPNVGESSFDALAVTFQVSSAKPLDNAYAVIVAHYHGESGSGNWVYAQPLGPIGAEPRAVRIEHGGFPEGFELQDFQVHLYNADQEVATNVSSKRVSLTPDEAFEFVVMDYVGSHKGATLPAMPAMGKLPPDLGARLASGDLAQTYYVKVSKDGLANDVFLDQACTKKVEDPYVVAVVDHLRFKPALQQGTPVEGVAALNLNQIMAQKEIGG